MTHTETCGICGSEVPRGEACRSQQQAEDCVTLAGSGQRDPGDYQIEQFDDRDR